MGPDCDYDGYSDALIWAATPCHRYYTPQYARVYMLAQVGSVLFLDKLGINVLLFVLFLLRDLETVSTFS